MNYLFHFRWEFPNGWTPQGISSRVILRKKFDMIIYLEMIVFGLDGLLLQHHCWFSRFYSRYNLMDTLKLIIGWYFYRCLYGKCWWYLELVPEFSSGVKMANENELFEHRIMIVEHWLFIFFFIYLSLYLKF